MKNKITTLLLIVLIFLFSNCSKEEIIIPDFSYEITKDKSSDGVTVKFTNLSEGARGYVWDFGDGITSENHNEVHIFKNGGNHNVKLTLRRGNEFSQITKTVSIAPLLVGFNYVVDNSSVVDVTFTDITRNYTANADVRWDFGDGDSRSYNISNGWQETIEHTYPRGGVYMATLEYTQGTEQKFISKAISIPTLNANIGVVTPESENPSIHGDSVRWRRFRIENAQNIINATVIWDFGNGSTETFQNVNISNNENSLFMMSIALYKEK